jgi:hypothetical protein
MAKKATKPKAVHVFAVGDRVEILHFGKGKVVELRGPLGPDGSEVYRIMYQRKPSPRYIEVWAEQIRPLKVEKPRKPVVDTTPPAEPRPIRS